MVKMNSLQSQCHLPQKENALLLSLQDNLILLKKKQKIKTWFPRTLTRQILTKDQAKTSLSNNQESAGRYIIRKSKMPTTSKTKTQMASWKWMKFFSSQNHLLLKKMQMTKFRKRSIYQMQLISSWTSKPWSNGWNRGGLKSQKETRATRVTQVTSAIWILSVQRMVVCRCHSESYLKINEHYIQTYFT